MIHYFVFLIFTSVKVPGSGVFENRLHDLRIDKGTCFPVYKAEPFAIAGKNMIVPPAAGNSSGPGRRNIPCRKIDTILNVPVFFESTILIDHDRNAVFNKTVVKKVHKLSNLRQFGLFI